MLRWLSQDIPKAINSKGNPVMRSQFVVCLELMNKLDWLKSSLIGLVLCLIVFAEVGFGGLEPGRIKILNELVDKIEFTFDPELAATFLDSRNNIFTS
jgi:hypothetical protein